MCLLSACTSKPRPAFSGTDSDLSSRAQTRERDGARVTVEVFTDQERCQTYFGLPTAYRDGLAILFVKVENTDPSLSLLVGRTNLHLLLGSAVAVAGTAQHGANSGEAIALAGTAIGSPLFIIVGGTLASKTAMVRENFVTKELRSDTLAPGTATSGFAYFQLDKQALLKDGGTVRINLRRPLASEQFSLEIPVPKP